MKIVVIGGSGLVGSQVVTLVRQHGHDAFPASLHTGVNTLTGQGLAEALAGAEVVVDLANSPSFDDDDVMEFFTTSTTNLTTEEKACGVRHHVALSVVGCDRSPDSGYLRAKVAQEQLIASSGVPYSIIRSTQFFEFGKAIAEGATVGNQVRLPHAYFQPVASAETASLVARASIGKPQDGFKEIAGPERFHMNEFIAAALERIGDSREVVVDPHATYFGQELEETTLLPGPDAELGTVRYDQWVTDAARMAAAPGH